MVVSMTRAILAAIALLLALAGPREARERPTVQRRSAPKQGLLYANALIMTHVRDDFYTSWGYGGDLGFFLFEWLGVELRFAKLETSLVAAAVDLKGRVGLTPDARPQDLWAHVGVRWAPAYAKMLLLDSFVLHFEPQLALHAGIAQAEARTLPSFVPSLSLLLHFSWNIKAKLDLGVSVQAEQRDRGWIWSVGFVPTLGVGWGFNFL